MAALFTKSAIEEKSFRNKPTATKMKRKNFWSNGNERSE
jgi:hypothetical protein